MGSSSSKKTVQSSQLENRKLIELKRIFKVSQFHKKSPFWTKSCSFFTGGYNCTSFTDSLFKAFQNFMILVSIPIQQQGLTNTGPKTPNLTPPPLVEEVWSLALQYSDPYTELCNNLIGEKLYRTLGGGLEGFEQLFLNYWPGYLKDFWQLDRKHTVWILDSELELFLKQVHEYVFLRSSLKQHQEVFQIYFHLNMVRNMLSKVKNYETCKRFYCEPRAENYFYGLDLSVAAEEHYEKILESLEKDVKEYIDSKLCFGDLAQFFFEEYARFLTMVYFQPSLVTPSHSVEMIWKVHRSLSLDYYRFCQKTFGKEIEYVTIEDRFSLKVNLVKGYQKTLDLYVALFRQQPPQVVWPAIDDWVYYNKYNGSWFSLLRIIESTQKVFEIYNSKEFKTIPVLAAYFCWGKNLKNEKLKDFIESKKVTKVQTENIIFLDQGTEPLEAKWNHSTANLDKNGSVVTKKTKEFKESDLIYDSQPENAKEHDEKNDERRAAPNKTGKSEEKKRVSVIKDGKKKDDRISPEPKKIKTQKKTENKDFIEEKNKSPKKVSKEDLKSEEANDYRSKNKSPKKVSKEDLKSEEVDHSNIKNKSPKKSENVLLDDSDITRKQKKNKGESPAKQKNNLLDDSDFLKNETKNKRNSPAKGANKLLDDSDFVSKPSKQKSPGKELNELSEDEIDIKEAKNRKYSKKESKNIENSPIRAPDKPEKHKKMSEKPPEDQDLDFSDDEAPGRKLKTMKEKQDPPKDHKNSSKSKDNSFSSPKKIKNENLLELESSNPN